MDKPHLIDIPIIEDSRGNLSFLQHPEQVPFDIKRVYWLYDVPGGEIRGSHAKIQTQEILVVLSGSLKVTLFDGHQETQFHLSRSYTGLYIPNMTWRTLSEFSTNSVALILASTLYCEADYIRGYDDFLKQR